MEKEKNKAIEMPLLILRGMSVFPSTITHFEAGREKSLKAIEEAMEKEQMIFLTTQKEIDIEVIRRKEYKNNYIKDLKASGKYGKNYDQIFKVQSDPLYDKGKLKQSNNKSTESYRMIIMDLNKIDTNGRI